MTNEPAHSELTIIPEVGLTEIGGEPRCRDIDLAERLGFGRSRRIRELIKSNLSEILTFGPAPCRAAMVDRPQGGGSDAAEYWLNEEQVLLVATLSKAPNAPAVRAMLIRVFVAWRRGHLVGADAMPAQLAEYIRRTDGIARMLSHKVTEMEKVLAAVAGIVQPAHPIIIRHGKTAGQIWHAFGYPPIKITNWFSNRLRKFGCEIEGRGELGLTRSRLFDPDKAEAWIKDGGGDLLIKQKIAERQGQGRLRLVSTEVRP